MVNAFKNTEAADLAAIAEVQSKGMKAGAANLAKVETLSTENAGAKAALSKAVWNNQLGVTGYEASDEFALRRVQIMGAAIDQNGQFVGAGKDAWDKVVDLAYGKSKFAEEARMAIQEARAKYVVMQHNVDTASNLGNAKLFKPIKVSKEGKLVIPTLDRNIPTAGSEVKWKQENDGSWKQMVGGAAVKQESDVDPLALAVLGAGAVGGTYLVLHALGQKKAQGTQVVG